ncbi:MAG: hypothetical protein A3F72_03585 [Bacteroidetes bacterium RIFCSPLOWO2_12_FULL_35_15]|nr:MAG: hypothetical protein A3F72_03585 [Bacteroidetes bacterium RIFCSPLOWO2_12_FULL_35_15]
MQNEINISIIEKLDAVQASMNSIVETLDKIQKEQTTFGDWISEKETISITGLSRSTLLKLRKTGKVRKSTFTGKQLYYKLSDFKKLLDKNEFEF